MPELKLWYGIKHDKIGQLRYWHFFK